jgi:hypothetical protein
MGLGSGQVGSGQVGSGQVGSGQVGSGQVGSGQVGSGQVGSGQPYPPNLLARPTKTNSTDPPQPNRPTRNPAKRPPDKLCAFRVRARTAL